MGVKLGLAAKLYYNAGSYGSPTWTELSNVRDLSLDSSISEADATTRASGGHKVAVPTQMESPIEWDSVYDTADAAFMVFLNAYYARTPIEVAVMDGSILISGARGLRATCAVFKANNKQGLDGVQMTEFSIKPTYAENAPSVLTI